MNTSAKDRGYLLKKDELSEHHAFAMRDHLHHRSVALLLEDEAGQVTEVGSGTLIEIGGRCFVATVAHNFDNRQMRQVGVCPYGDVGHYSHLTPKNIAWGRRDDSDLGWIELHPNSATSMQPWGSVFVPLDRIRVAPMGKDQPMYLLGQPSEFIKSLTIQGKPVVGLRALPIFVPTVDVQAGGDPARDIYLMYPERLPTTHGTMELPRAFGLSGSGIWAVNPRSDGFWSPDMAQLVAIQRSWREWEWLRGTYVSEWLLMVKEDVPELASLIEPVLAI